MLLLRSLGTFVNFLSLIRELHLDLLVVIIVVCTLIEKSVSVQALVVFHPPLFFAILTEDRRFLASKCLIHLFDVHAPNANNEIFELLVPFVENTENLVILLENAEVYRCVATESGCSIMMRFKKTKELFRNLIWLFLTSDTFWMSDACKHLLDLTHFKSLTFVDV